jgi:hypothetical protein
MDIFCHLNLDEFSLITIGPVAGAQRVLKQMHLIPQFACKHHIKLSHDFIVIITFMF